MDNHIFSSRVRIMYRLNWLMFVSERIDGRIEFHKIGPLYLILNYLVLFPS